MLNPSRLLFFFCLSSFLRSFILRSFEWSFFNLLFGNWLPLDISTVNPEQNFHSFSILILRCFYDRYSATWMQIFQMPTLIDSALQNLVNFIASLLVHHIVWHEIFRGCNVVLLRRVIVHPCERPSHPTACTNSKSVLIIKMKMCIVINNLFLLTAANMMENCF